MDSKQFSLLLATKRNESGISIEQLSTQIGVTPAIVKDIEHGVYNTSMELAMKYISAIGRKLVVSQPADFVGGFGMIVIPDYEDFVKWISKTWPNIYTYKRGRLDAYGVNHFSVGERGGNGNGIGRKRFIELMERRDYTLEILNNSEIEQKKLEREQVRAAMKEVEKKEKQKMRIGVVLAVLMLFVAIYPCIKWVDLMCWLADWMHANQPSQYFANLMWLGLGLCVYIVAIPFGVLAIAVFLASLPITRSLTVSTTMAFGALVYFWRFIEAWVYGK